MNLWIASFVIYSTPLVICGTKADLKTSGQKGPFVKFGNAKRLARTNNCAGPVECSALRSANLDTLFNLGNEF